MTPLSSIAFIKPSCVAHSPAREESFSAEGETDELAAEYCQLFIGPKQSLAPFQSVWEKGELQTEIATSVQQFADLLNYQRCSDYPATMTDHLGIQLDIMSRVTAPLMRESLGQLASEVAGEFFLRHLTWPQRLLAAAKARVGSKFYRGVFDITTEFLKSQRVVWLAET